jgi:phosphoribosylamine-glycine ligase
MLLLAAEVMTLTGTVIDNKCAESNKADLANFVKTHTKECALMPACVASGYAIFADGKLMAFNKDSNIKVEEFLKKDTSKTQVVVKAKMAGQELSLISIENQK